MKIPITPSARRGIYAMNYALIGLFLALPLMAQLEPCGFYEVDNRPGYSIIDLRFVASRWPAVGTFPSVPDHNGDGQLNIIDLVLQANCKDDLAPGLVASYYGFQTGDPAQVLTFPNIDSLAFEPTVVKAIDRIEDFQGWDAFLNSDMRDFFAARFEGYLWVPENATYTLTTSGRQGMRVRLDGNQIMDFDGWPYNDSATLVLSYGLHPLRIDYYAGGDSQASLTWSSNGPIVGSTNTTIGPDYLYHEYKTLPQHAVGDLSIVFDPPSGSVAHSNLPHIQAWLLSHHGDVSLNILGSNRVLYDGKFDTSQLRLENTGLNAIPYTVSDADGHTLSGIYYLSKATHVGVIPGLAANVYTDDWWQGVVPAITTQKPIDTAITVNPQMILDGNQRLFLNGQYVPPGTIVEFSGALRIPTAGEYRFRIDDGPGALYINGQQICAIGNDYPNQWVNDGSIYLEEAYYSFRVRSGQIWSSPSLRVFWTRPDSPEELIPNNKFYYDPTKVVMPPTFLNSTGTGTRHKLNQVAEYVFDPAAPFKDTSGNGFDLPYDARAYIRSGGGITYETVGGTGSLQAGSHIVARVKDGSSLTLEVDFVYDDVMDWHERRLISLSSRWDTLMAVYTRDNDLYVEISDLNGTTATAQANNVITQGARHHVMAAYNGSNLILLLNGVEVATTSVQASLALWPAQVSLNVGQNFFRANDPSTWGYQQHGTFLVAAAYLERLSTGNASNNRTANLAINPTPATLVHAAAPQFPPAGTSQSDFDTAFHVLNRTSYGPSPTTLNEILTTGIDTYLAQQLNPLAIDDSALDAQLATGIFGPTKYRRDLQGLTTYRMASSRRQLLEVMTQFWENHFNTQTDKTDNLVEEYAENQRFRSLALGDFVELLKTSAMHMPMTVYLDSDSNVVGAANENYAREILELHTYGVNNGYTQDDIVEAARCFTGWTVRNGSFYFDAGLHDYGAKSLLGMNIPAGGGFSDGIAVIEHIAASPNTAAFLSWKLCQVFIDDDPPADVLNAAITTFSNSGGDIKQVLETIFAHARFRSDTSYRANKIKNPLEFGVSLLRATETPPAYNSLPVYLAHMGMDLFNYPDPTGFDEEGIGWMDTNSLLSRWNMANDFTTNRLNPITPSINMKALKQRFGWTTYDDVLDFFENVTSHGTEPAGTRAITQSWLTADNPGGFILNDATLDGRARQTFGLYLRLPEFNKQ